MHIKVADYKAIDPSVKQYCKCGCQKELPPQVTNPRYHVLEYIRGHRRSVEVNRFVTENTGKHKCQCGCGELLEIKKRHLREGIPRFKILHYLRTKEYTDLRIPVDSHGYAVSTRKTKQEFTFWQKVELLRRSDYKCQACGPVIDYTKLQFDHAIALALGGKTSVENGQTLCRDCHTAKTMEEKRKFGFDSWRHVG